MGGHCLHLGWACSRTVVFICSDCFLDLILSTNRK
jgi:hypothetical protein